MDNVVTAVFKEEVDAFEAFAELRQNPFANGYELGEVVLLRNEGVKNKMLDSFDTGANTADDATVGMLVGAVVGVLTGPLGVFVGACAGGAIGSFIDTHDFWQDASMIEIVSTKLYEGEVAIIALARENEENALDTVFSKYDPMVVRLDAAEVALEVERARKVLKELESTAITELRADKTDELQARIEEHREAIGAHLDEIIAKSDAILGKAVTPLVANIKALE
ncbi:MAG: DUF1269 domain-containing protein [Eggerthellaceae bacterium]|nr:DUF1269 domain-containing protein [Eggerthellaceae bacterium]